MNASFSSVVENAANYYSASACSKPNRKARTADSETEGTRTGTSREEMALTKTEETEKKTQVGGRTIGTPELSEKAAKYYEELKRKYGNLDFILVSKDMKDFAKANASKYGNASKMVVLIDEEKIERMAEDEKFRSQYEGIIAKGASGLSQLKNRLASMGMNVKSCGINVYDNGASSFFATMDKSFKAQSKKQQEKQAAKKAAKKAEEKKAQKEKQQERIKKIREERDDIKETDEDVTFTADSIEELMEKIESMDHLFRNGIFDDRKEHAGRRVDLSI